VAAIQEDFGIPIQHYVELNFDSFASVVNALGGINMYFPEPVYDPESDLDVTTVGCHHLNGFHALQVVRARHLVHKGRE
jgi:LCP family protein required for cell wall assembly